MIRLNRHLRKNGSIWTRRNVSASSRTIIVAHYTDRVRFRLPVGGWPRSFLSRASRLHGGFRARYALAAGCPASRRRGDAIQGLPLLHEIGTDGPPMTVWSASRLRR